MGVYFELNENKNTVLALGFFDGVHFAHQTLIKKTVELAQKNGIKSALITFLDSPFYILTGKNPSYITLLVDKINLIQNLGVDDIYVLDFNKYKLMEADDYIHNVLIEHFHPKFIVTGFNHRFGANKKGDSKLLSSFNHDFNYVEINPIYENDILISSTNIKKFISDGEIELANKMLNRNFSIKGTVIKGQEIARTLGYRTANIILDNKLIKPKYGVYFGYSYYKNTKYPSLINFGIRPSVDKNLVETLEVHLLNFNKNLYGEELKVEFETFRRGEIKFSNIEELKNQINSDYLALLDFIKE